MEVAKAHQADGTLTGSDSFGTDELLGDVWDWCPLKGCRPVTYAGKIYLKKGPYEKYRYVRSLGADCVLMSQTTICGPYRWIARHIQDQTQPRVQPAKEIVLALWVILLLWTSCA